jgi:hypothetical protein
MGMENDQAFVFTVFVLSAFVVALAAWLAYTM